MAKLDDSAAPPVIRPQPVAEIDPTNSIQLVQVSGETEIVQRIVAQLPWAHNIILIQKLKDLPTRLWYARQAIAQGWSRDTLTLMIKSHTHDRQGAAVTNFDTQLPQPHAQLAQDTLKDPYIFEFEKYKNLDAKRLKSVNSVNNEFIPEFRFARHCRANWDSL